MSIKALNTISFKNIWLVSFPIILSNVAQNIVNVTDTAFLGHVGEVELGAAGNAGIFYFVMVMLGFGFSVGCQILIGRRNGEGNYLAIGNLFNVSLFASFGMGIIMFLLLRFGSEAFLSNFTSSQRILENSIAYLDYRSVGIIFVYINVLFMAFFTGITKTKILVFITLAQSGINVFLDYGMIFGNFGFPEMGIEGAAIASVISEASATGLFIFYTLKFVDLPKYGLFQFKKLDGSALKRAYKIASPIMLQNTISLSSWFIFFLIIEQIGERELAVSHIVRSIYMVMMIPLFGFSSATSALVSNVIGEGGVNHVFKLVRNIIILSVSFTLIMMAVNLIFPHEILSIYTQDVDLINACLPVLQVITATMFLFSIAFILFSAVTGTGNTLHSLAIEIVTIVAYLYGAYLIGVKYDFSIATVWCSEFIYFGGMGILSFFYLWKYNWQQKTI
jgi:putative MATE family efflux protein